MEMKGFVFTADIVVSIAIIAVILPALFLVSISDHSHTVYQRINIYSDDVSYAISHVKIIQFKNETGINELFQQGMLKSSDENLTISEAMVKLWASGNVTQQQAAAGIYDTLFGDFIPENADFGLMINNETFYSSTNSSLVASSVSRIYVTGYRELEPKAGYSAKAGILNIDEKSYSSYIFFGGFVGQGKVTSLIKDIPPDSILTKIYIEMNTPSNFDFYLNNIFCGYYEGSPDNFSVVSYYITGSCLQSFNAYADNNITIDFLSNRSDTKYLGGGYAKLDYITSQLVSENMTYEKYYFPGIDGIINIYSSFYVPGKLVNLTAFLHYRSNYTIFLKIGNVSVYEGNFSSETNLMIPINQSLINYSSFDNKNIPVRVGLKNVSYITIGGEGVGDVVLSTDVSGSMDYCGNNSYSPLYCTYYCLFTGYKTCVVGSVANCRSNVCGGFCILPSSHYVTCPPQSRMYFAKIADKDFVNIVLNTTGNRIGLNSYSDNIINSENLTNNATYLNSKIDLYSPENMTCICCGIENGMALLNKSGSDRRKSIVIMTDGEANVRCNSATSDINGDGKIDAKDDVIQSACNAYNHSNITVYTVGFSYSESDIDNKTLRLAANCTKGQYYFANSTGLATTFREIAREVVRGSYNAQMISFEGNLSSNNTLYPDSYIGISYIPVNETPKGYKEIEIRQETPYLENCTDSFFIPADFSLIDAYATAYSGNYWTNKVSVRSNNTNDTWKDVFLLEQYGNNYSSLGDPFVIRFNGSYLASNRTNWIKIELGMGPGNSSSACSLYNRVIYTARIKASVPYGGIFPELYGRNVTVYYDIDHDGTADGVVNVYYGTNTTGFNPVLVDVEDLNVTNNALDDAFQRLLDAINFVKTGSGPSGSITNPVDIKISENMETQFTLAEDVPFFFGPVTMGTEVKI